MFRGFGVSGGYFRTEAVHGCAPAAPPRKICGASVAAGNQAEARQPPITDNLWYTAPSKSSEYCWAIVSSKTPCLSLTAPKLFAKDLQVIPPEVDERMIFVHAWHHRGRQPQRVGAERTDRSTKYLST